MVRWVLALIAVLVAGPALAAESDAVRSPQAEVRLISDVDAIAPGQPFRVALYQKLATGWHTYWTNPGDAGQPPELTLGLPEGARAGELTFAAPHRLPFGPLVNFGYAGTATFTMTVTPPATLKPGDRFALTGDATWLVCERICIPEEGSFRLDLPVAARAQPSADVPLFVAAEAAQPRPSPFATRIGFEGSRGVLELTGEGLAPNTVRDAFFYPAAWGLIDHAAAQPLTVRGDHLTLTLTRGQSPLPASVGGVVELTDAAGVRAAYTIAATPGPMPDAGSALPLGQALAWALLGGLILNLMPCVFPILAMKAVAIAKLGGADRAAVRAQAGGYTLGVVLSFVVLGGGLAAAQAAGLAAGWGFQFTQPGFVAAMAWLMLAVGLNLSGVFGIGGPVAVGSALAARGGHLGAFMTGVLAVLVATPCTAPFMAAAIGAALAMPPAATLAVFAAMGLGMALPYALLGVFPGAARALPRPGAWMERLKQFLAFPMYGAAAWLVWVLAQESGADGVLLGLGGALLIALAAWLVGQAQTSGRTGARVGRALAGIAVIAALALLPRLAPSSPSQTAELAAERWSSERVSALQAEGRPVFVNLTAAWCISCKVNERVALKTDAVQTAFANGNVAYLTGDWTRGDPAITALLRAHGREGVPLYLFYPAGGGAPVVLPQILTEGIVLQTLDAAHTKTS